MSVEQPRFHVHKITAQTHTHTHLHKSLPHTHHSPLHTHMILYMPILLHTHIHKIPPRSNHRPLHTHVVIHTKILTHKPVTHTRKYYSYKKLSQSPHLPWIRRNTLIKCCIQNTLFYVTTQYGPSHPCMHWDKI